MNAIVCDFCKDVITPDTHGNIAYELKQIQLSTEYYIAPLNGYQICHHCISEFYRYKNPQHDKRKE